VVRWSRREIHPVFSDVPFVEHDPNQGANRGGKGFYLQIEGALIDKPVACQ
jgi:hypothetical protein